MTIEEFNKAMENVPKIQTNNHISSMNSISVDELIKTAERFKRIPTFDDLQKENNKLLNQKQELIDYSKEKIKEQDHKLNTLDFGLNIVHTKSKIITYQEILSKIEKR